MGTSPKWIENGSLEPTDADFAFFLKKAGHIAETIDDILDELREEYNNAAKNKEGDFAFEEEKEVADKAKALQERLKSLKEKFGKEFIGGIVVEEAKVWYYNDSSLYSKVRSVNDSNDWKPFESLF